MRNALGSLFVIMASVLLGSCGGGGAASPGPIGGPPQIQPEVGTLYAGVEYTFTVSGGRPPYTMSSSEPQLLSVPTILNGNFFTVVPNNTGVVDTGLPPGSLPVRTVVISMRDTIGNTAATSGLTVAQNFFTGYGYTLAYLSNCTAGSACAGGETALALSATIGGNLVGNRAYRFDIVRGPFFWVNGNGTIAGNSITVNTDHEGTAHVIFRVNNNVATQLAVFRVTDIATGTSTTHVFTIAGIPVSGALEVIPEELLFTGPNSATCGTGQADVLVFDGIPPYRATSSTANLTVTPETSNSNPGVFRIAATNPFVCLADATVVITDSNNSRTTVTVDTALGAAAPPPNPITVIPGALPLDCGQQGSFTIAGGPTTGGSFTISKPGIVDPRVTAVVASRNITITRNTPDAGAVLAPRVDETFTFTVTDSANNTNTTTVSVVAPSVCPHL
jgi:hypothetical protein